MDPLKETFDKQLKDLLKDGEEFHGHLGPFLVVGIRAGVIGLRELKGRKGDRDLSVRIMLENVIPISCIVDGLQITTGCTIGNKRLSIEDSVSITMEFKNRNGGLELTTNQTFFEGLKSKLLGKKLGHEEIIEMGYEIATMDEQEIFKVSRI